MKLPVIEDVFVNASTSSLLSKLLVIWTVALSMFVSSTSETVSADVIAVALPPSVNDSALVSALANTGASLTATTSMVRVCVFESLSPSLTVNVTVRCDVLGLSVSVF